jgi:hypothetical protein
MKTWSLKPGLMLVSIRVFLPGDFENLKLSYVEKEMLHNFQKKLQNSHINFQQESKVFQQTRLNLVHIFLKKLIHQTFSLTN